jgi:hypothetical protein
VRELRQEPLRGPGRRRHTVWRWRGLPGSASTLARSRRMCTVTVDASV